MKKLSWLSLSVLLFAGCVTPGGDDEASQVSVATNENSSRFELFGEFSRPEEPDGLSGITRTADGRFFAVNDSGGLLHELKFNYDMEGVDGSCEVVRTLALPGRKDLEGCAYDPLTGWIWVSDEADTSVNAYDLESGEHKATLPVPEIYRKSVRPNNSLESLTISPDGKRLYFANEDTLMIDGDKANREHGGKVRVQEFVRNDGIEWRLGRQFFYETDPIEGAPFKTYSISSLADICADERGVLYFLERELSVKDGFFPTFRARLYRAQLSEAQNAQTLTKALVYEENTGFSNYEGLSRLSEDTTDAAAPVFLLISDGDGPCAKNFALLKHAEN